MDLVAVRIALGILFYGLGCVIIDWATGPLSPSAMVPGLLPTHVVPLRRRLRVLIVTLIASFVVLGQGWLSAPVSVDYALGRLLVTLAVAISLLAVVLYMRRIPGLQGRFRLLRYASLLAIMGGIVAMIFGYHNFAGYLIHGATRTALALIVLWILLWLVLIAFEAVIESKTETAAQFRRNLGVTEEGSRTGVGFMQLIADLVLWLSFVVYLIYVWDSSGNQITELTDKVMEGYTVGNIKLVPVEIIGGIIVFAALIVVIGWIKRWIDRRWLRHMGLDRGARDALVTLFGYVGFISAALLGLTYAGVDLGGLAIVSGALAVGIGFGLQAIVNNFVSGLILLFERPIKAGDFVTVGDTEGSVRRIRIRATEIETLDNQNVMVPNSELVSGRVTNWVLRNPHGRLRIQIGVAYGTDVEKVKQILESIAAAHKEVISDGRAPAPRALFMGFGDSSLDFELRVRIKKIERRFTVLSDINFAIDRAFREAEISIPFPQRDLHLVTLPEQEAAPAKAPDVEAVKPEPPTPVRPAPSVEQITRSYRHEIELTSTLEATWTALTDADELKRWHAREAEVSARIAGKYLLTLTDDSEFKARVDIFMPPRRLRLVLAPQEGESPLPSGPITEEFVLRQQDDTTILTIIVSGIPATEDWEQFYRSSEDRWENSIAELKRVLGNRSSV